MTTNISVAGLDVLTVDDLAARWHVHPDSVRSLIASGALRASRVGRQLRVRVSDADAYLTSTETS